MNNPFSVRSAEGTASCDDAQFQQFKANFHGDPKAEVEKLLQSGKHLAGSD